MSSVPKSSPDKEIIKSFEAGGVVEYLEYLQSGKRIMWVNFRAGVAKGFGVTVGATLVLGIAIWIMTMMVDLPIVGEYFDQAQQYITEYAEKTNYEDEFAEQIRLLQEIEAANKQQVSPNQEVD
jgi:hypothetical protein